MFMLALALAGVPDLATCRDASASYQGADRRFECETYS